MTLELTAHNVLFLAGKCWHQEGEELLLVNSARGVYHFAKERLQAHEVDIGQLLEQLPVAFRSMSYGEGAGGGWTFLNACVREDGTHWGEHLDLDFLLGLGLGIGRVSWSLPREMWGALPGGMPYFQINPPAENKAAE